MKIYIYTSTAFVAVKHQAPGNRQVTFAEISNVGKVPVVENLLIPTHSNGNVYFTLGDKSYSSCDVDHTKYRGFAICNPNDDFNLEYGYQLALKRVLRSFSREFRSLVWAGFFEYEKPVHDEYPF